MDEPLSGDVPEKILFVQVAAADLSHGQETWLCNWSGASSSVLLYYLSANVQLTHWCYTLSSGPQYAIPSNTTSL